MNEDLKECGLWKKLIIIEIIKIHIKETNILKQFGFIEAIYL